MILTLTLFALLLVPNNVQSNQANFDDTLLSIVEEAKNEMSTADTEFNLAEDEFPGDEEKGRVFTKIESCFKDVTDLTGLCDEFEEDYGVSICEMESGNRQRNSGGRLLAKINQERFNEYLNGLGSHEESRKLKGSTMLSHSGTGTGPTTCSVTKPTRNDKEILFDHTIIFLMADSEFASETLSDLEEYLAHFNYCAEGKTNFQLDPHYITVNVTGMNWMEATYEVLNKAVEDGIDISTEYDEESKKYLFNTGTHMTMIILPDHVEFGESYGFAALHNGLSVLFSDSAKRGKNVLHEIGHNLGMKHSSTSNDEYGDDRCTMGNPHVEAVCFNGHKSYYLGFYYDHTAVITKETPCNVIVKIADIHDHLSNERVMQSTHGEYYVLAVVKIPIGKISKTAFMMYYEDEDIVSVTVGDLGSISMNEDNLFYAEQSERIFDLKVNESNIYEEVLIKRCQSSGIAKVLISYDINAPNACV